MPVTPQWLQMMARYNAWQNGWMVEAASGLSEVARRQDRGAFFGSIHGTLSHLLWGDTLWMSRFDGGAPPDSPIERTTANYPDWEAYRILRSEMDHRIESWADNIDDGECRGDLVWFSGLQNSEMSQPKPMVFTHFFNHQTHHRGQVHAMLTAAGAQTLDTDLIFMEIH